MELQQTLIADILDLRSSLISKTDRLLSLLGVQSLPAEERSRRPSCNDIARDSTGFQKKSLRDLGIRVEGEDFASIGLGSKPSLFQSKVITSNSSINKPVTSKGNSKIKLASQISIEAPASKQVIHSGSLSLSRPSHLQRTISLRTDHNPSLLVPPSVSMIAETSGTSMHFSESNLSRYNTIRQPDKSQMALPKIHFDPASRENTVGRRRSSLPVSPTTFPRDLLPTTPSFDQSDFDEDLSPTADPSSRSPASARRTRDQKNKSDYLAWKPTIPKTDAGIPWKNQSKYLISRTSLVSPPTGGSRFSFASRVLSAENAVSLQRPATIMLSHFSLSERVKFWFLLPVFDNKGELLDLSSFEIDDLHSIDFKVNGLHPKSEFSTLWDTLMIVTYFTFIWLVPLFIGFNVSGNTMFQFQIVISLIFIVDSTITIITPQSKVTESTPTFMEYEAARPTLPEWILKWTRKQLVVDIISLLPFMDISNSKYGSLINLLRLLRMYRIPAMMKRCAFMRKMKLWFDDKLGIGVSKTLPIAMGILTFIHFNACSTYYVGRMSGFVGWDALWPGSSQANMFEAYTWTFFLAVGNLFPMSFKPQTASEQIVATIYICSGAILYAAFVGYISSAAISFNASGRLYNQKMEELIDYVKWKKLDIETRNKLVAYYETKYRGKYFEEDALLSDMNESLREQIACHNTRRLIENVNFLLRDERDGRDDIYYNKLALKLHACYFVPGDFVMKQGDSGTDMYFISTGRVNVYVNGIKVASLNDAAYFGEKSMVSKAKRMGTIQVVAPSVLYRLTRGDFLDVINEFPDMKARFQSIEEEMGKTDYMKRKLSRFEGNLFSKSRVNNQDSV